jgi:outer membrane receptor protein involved in Fe transport
LSLKTSIVALLLMCAARAQTAPLTGTVRDASGRPVAGATVAVNGSSATTNEQGEFRIDGVAPPAEVTVTTPLAGARATWHGEPLAITLGPVREDTVTVTARGAAIPVDETAADVVLLPETQIDSSGALTADDILRQVPGFSLFRRSGSRVANPTTQGVSLRGMGPSGASRALVLRDGVPLNDPFGGWVYWGRVPPLALERAEVLRGGASDLYGSDALSGVVNLVKARPSDDLLNLDFSLGNETTPDLQLLASKRMGAWTATLTGDVFSTDGYVVVDPAERGAVDTPANARDQEAELAITRAIRDGFVRATGEFFGEYRHNGTPLQTNRTGLGQGTVETEFTRAAGRFAFRFYGSGQRYNQSFSAIAPDRSSEALTRLQRVPAEQAGGSAEWSRVAGRNFLVAGFDARSVQGDSDELGFTAGIATRHFDAGGTTRSVGVYGQDTITLTRRLSLTAGVRGDFWRNTDGFSAVRPLVPPGANTLSTFPDRSENAASPSAALLYRPNEHWSFTASGYRAFRAPTLNELYRGFRVGNILTLANQDLQAERLTGAEGGVRYSGSRFALDATYFWAQINRPVENVTLSVTPALITRQRQNLGQTRTTGVELGATVHFTEHFDLRAGYLYANAVVTSFAADPTLVGLDVPQVPRNTFTFQAHYARSRWTLSAQGRALSTQFDDDQNLLPLDAFFSMDTFVSYRAERHVELYVATENLFDQRYQVGRTPVVTLGPPILVRGGIRLHLERKR